MAPGSWRHDRFHRIYRYGAAFSAFGAAILILAGMLVTPWEESSRHAGPRRRRHGPCCALADMPADYGGAIPILATTLVGWIVGLVLVASAAAKARRVPAGSCSALVW